MTTTILGETTRGTNIGSQSHSPDHAIATIVKSQADAWNHYDAAAFSQDFTEDATFINIRGDLVKGRGD